MKYLYKYYSNIITQRWILIISVCRAAILHPVHRRTLLLHRPSCPSDAPVPGVHGCGGAHLGQLADHALQLPDGESRCPHSQFFYSNDFENMKFQFWRFHANLFLFRSITAMFNFNLISIIFRFSWKVLHHIPILQVAIFLWLKPSFLLVFASSEAVIIILTLLSIIILTSHPNEIV